MRSSFGSHNAGFGTYTAFIEQEEVYRDHKVMVRLPSDSSKKDNYKSLSGPVKIYNLYEQAAGAGK